jgi:ribosomal-protein-alanine N-acetyltransferase
MDYHFVPFTVKDARQVATWHYPEKYAFYDESAWQLTISASIRPFMALTGTYLYSVYADRQRRDLIGIFDFVKHGGEIEIGLALRPDLTGQGNGLAFVQAGMDVGKTRFRPRAFILYVATFNLRAITVYERAGFQKERQVRRFTSHGYSPHWLMRCPLGQ